MPAGNGLDVAKNIQSITSKATPIIFITASKKYRYQEEALKLGAAGFFEKPYDTEKLLGKVADLL
ncbi:MAG: DNA-binding NtrC family response regulator [Enterobacterales bacterium]|jgi:DNA-binding NtrC family response regulator